MFSKDAIEALQMGQAITAANAAALPESFGAMNPAVIIPEDFKLHSLEAFAPLRRRARGAMTTISVQAFAAYTTAHAEEGCAVFVDAANMQATAVLNLGEPDAPGHADNTATLKPVRTAAYVALVNHTASGIPQQKAAEFLEDWIDNVKCWGADEAPIKPRQAIAAIRRITIDAMRKVESEVQSLSASQSAFESVAASSKEPIPDRIYFTCKPYADLPERLFVLRLGILTGDKAPTIVLRIVKAEEHAEEMANELCELLGDHMKKIPTLIGSYTRRD